MRFIALVLLSCLAVPAMAGTVYRWTDAKGVVHYSDFRPPAGVKYQAQGEFKRSIQPSVSSADEPAAAPNTASQATASTGVSTRCLSARQSVQALAQADVPVMMDLNGDGEAEPMTPETQQRQLELARAQERAFCSP